MHSNLKHIFFDLDRTLWDFETNTRKTLSEICERYDMYGKGVPDFEDFYTVFNLKNDICWELYRQNKMGKDTLRVARFRMLLQHYKISPINSLSKEISVEFLRESPLKTVLFPEAEETLTYLAQKYELHIITNGFEEVQHIKLKSAGIDKHLTHIITSEKAGYKKPHPRIFSFALELSKASAKESLMVGDDLKVDINGALNAGMQAVLFDPEGKYPEGEEYKTIQNLNELRMML